MSARELRQAAQREREEWGGDVNSRVYGRAAAIHVALADWLDNEATRADYREDQQRHANSTRLRAEPFPCYYDASTEHAIKVARQILGGAE